MARWTGWFVLLLLFVGCDGGVVGLETAVSATPTVAPTSGTPELAYTGAPPGIGLGHLYGQVLWNGRPAPDLTVRICRDFSSFSGCRSSRFTVRTDPDGLYLFENLEPGNYGLSVQVAEPDQWLYVTDGVLGAYDFVIAPNETLIVAPQTIYKVDLLPYRPEDGAILEGLDVILSWQFYPDAVYYEVTLAPFIGQPIMMNRRVSETLAAIGLPSVDCDYRWMVAAFNAAGQKIAEMERFHTFKTTGAPESCLLAINQPPDDAEVNGRDLTLIWEPRLNARSYQVLMWNESDPARQRVLNFETMTEPRYRFQYPLAPGAYIWSVSAFDSNDEKIAASETHVFTVTGD